ncbi:hypothetical protein JCM16358_23250 [Halanaerocella petrolearia]
MDWKSLIGFKDFDTLTQEAKDKMENLKSRITNWNNGGVFKTLTYVALKGVEELYKLLVKVLPQGYVQYATGVWLELKVAEIGLERKPATKTKGSVTFVKDDPSANLKVEAGSIVKTKVSSQGEELRYFTTRDVVSVAGESQFEVEVEAEFAGAKYNVGTGYITTLVTHIPGVEEVSNSADWIIKEGTEEESDDSLRNRYFLKWSELSTGSTKDAYESWARATPGVVDVEIDDMHPRGQGTVDVIIHPASQELIQQVTDYINERKPLIDNVLVRDPEFKQIDFDIVLTLDEFYGDEQDIVDEAETIISAFFTENYDLKQSMGLEALNLGDDLYTGQITYYLMKIDNVVDVEIILPDDKTATAYELLTLGNINLATERAG